jgi:hypothetical protein
MDGVTLITEHVCADAAAAEPACSARQLDARIDHVASLDTPTIREMYELYDKYYAATSQALFEADLADKNFVITLRERSGGLAGFSTLAILDMKAGEIILRAIYSGDTIIDHAHWGTQALAFTWIRFAGILKAQAPERPLYWFLIVKGHRTYRYLSAFSVDFYPHWLIATPARAHAIMHDLARSRFAAAYDPGRGVVAFPRSRGHLRAEWAAVEPGEAARPDVSFFLRKNPGYVRGEELVCLTELSSENLRPLARRVFEQGLRA